MRIDFSATGFSNPHLHWYEELCFSDNAREASGLDRWQIDRI